MECFWDTVDCVVFERGVALRRADNSEWRCESSIQDLSVPPADFHIQHRLRPVTAQLRGYSGVYIVFPASRGRFLNVQVAELDQLIAKNSANYFQITRSLMFLLDAVIYHTEKLAAHYVTTLAAHTESARHRDGDWAMAVSNKAFFEFDALVTAVIRAIDSTRNIIWRSYGQNGSVPSSLHRTIKNCDRLPSSVKEQVENIWDHRLSHAKEYRDCIQHYVAVGADSWAKLTLLDNLFWTVSLRIPDNPEAKTATKFTYDRDLDAMTYAWELVTDLIGIAVLFIETTLLDNPHRE